MDTQPQVQAREHRARILEELIRTYRRQLENQVRFHSRSAEQAEEALSDACVQFMRFWDGPAGLPALQWLLVVAKRCAWAIGRRDRRRQATLGPLDFEFGTSELQVPLPDERPGPSEVAERSEETRGVIEMIERLKPDERSALIMLGLGCSYAEIAAARGWTYTKVNRCIAEGRQRIREQLEAGER